MRSRSGRERTSRSGASVVTGQTICPASVPCQAQCRLQKPASCGKVCPVTPEDGRLTLTQLEELSTGKRIRLARQVAGYSSQDAFAAALGMPNRRQVQRWEAGGVSPRKWLAEIARRTRHPEWWFTQMLPGERGGVVAELVTAVNNVKQELAAVRDEQRALREEQGALAERQAALADRVAKLEASAAPPSPKPARRRRG